MDHIERFHATIERNQVDRPCTWLGLPDPLAHEKLFRYFNVSNLHEMIIALDDDIIPVEMPYHSPTADAIYMAFDFAKKGRIDREHRTLNAPGFFEDFTDPARVDDFDWPDPAEYIDPEECRKVVENVPQDRAILGVIWSAHFQDLCAAFGMENAFIQMYQAPEVVLAVAKRITDFYLKANEIFFEATKGKLHAVLVGNDYAGQNGLLLSPELIRKFALPDARKIVQQAKSYGVKVIYHCCGSARDIIPDLIDIGIDALHPIQALAAGMEPEDLKANFGDRLSFVGGVDAQNLMVNGAPEQVRQKVRRLKEIFPTGLIISPSHEAILTDTPPENVKAIFEAAHNGA